MKRTVWFVLAVMLLLLVALAVLISDTPLPVLAQASGFSVVQTDAGQIAPARDSTAEVRIFKMIPYAAPPVGALRWKPPQPVAPWQGVRRADSFGPGCMGGSSYGPASVFYHGAQVVSEDCLYLNVWTPAKSGTEKLPVFVLIPTYEASGADPVFDGTALAKKGVVYVTVNYRLGVFGGLIHPELEKEPGGNFTSGNYMFLDEVAALKWVQKNIAALGGDPGNVTLWGAVEGTVHVGKLLASPLAKGLFHKAGGTGMSAFYNGTAGPNYAYSHAQGAELWAEWAKKNFNATAVADFRAVSAWDLAKAPVPYTVQRAYDPYFLADPLDTVYAKGQVPDIPLLIGWPKDGTTYTAPMATTAVSYTAAIKGRFGAASDQFLQLYPVKTDAEAVSQSYAFGADTFGWSQWAWATAHNKAGKTKAFVYYWTYAPPWLPGVKFAEQDPASKLGAYRSSDLTYALGTNSFYAAERQYSDVDVRLSDQMVSYLANFAKTGDPNGSGLPVWPAYDEKVDNSMLYIGAQTQAGPVSRKAQFSFLQTYYRSVVPPKVLIVISAERSMDMDLMLTKEIGFMVSQLEKAGFRAVVASPSGKPLTGSATFLRPDLQLANVKVEDYVGIYFACLAASVGEAGSAPPPEEAVAIAKKAAALGKPMAAERGGVYVLGRAGVMNGKQFAASTPDDVPGGSYKGTGVVQDGKFITSGFCPFMAKMGGVKDGTPELAQKFIALLKP